MDDMEAQCEWLKWQKAECLGLNAKEAMRESQSYDREVSSVLTRSIINKYQNGQIDMVPTFRIIIGDTSFFGLSSPLLFMNESGIFNYRVVHYAGTCNKIGTVLR